MTGGYETALLGAALRGYPNLPELFRIVQGPDFAQPEHEAIWDAIRTVHRDGKSPDPLMVMATMGRAAHRLPDGATYLTGLDCPLVAQAPFYAEKVREAKIRRDITELGARCQQIQDSDIAPGEAVRMIRDWADGIDLRAAPDVDPSESALEQVIDVAQNGEPDATPTPWYDLTEILGGWYPGQLITIGARPGVGKSIALENVASDLVSRDLSVKFFSLEMSAKELVQRRMAHTAKVALSALRKGRANVTEQDWERIERATAVIQEHPIAYSTKSQTIDTIAESAWDASRSAKASGRPLAAVCVDYCQLVNSTNRKISRQQQVGEVTRGLKRLARDLEIPVFTAAQLNRASVARQNPVPMLHDLREAGDIEQDSDVVLFLHEETVEDSGRVLPTGDVQMIVAKSRNTSQATITVRKHGHYARLASA